MAKTSPSKQRYKLRTRLYWAPVLRAVREFAITARKKPCPEGGHIGLRDPEVKTSAKRLLAAAQAWHSDWQRHRITTGTGFRTPQEPLPAPADPFHRIQRACKSYGYSLRSGSDQKEKTQAAMELFNSALCAPIGSGVFSERYSSETGCQQAVENCRNTTTGPLCEAAPDRLRQTDARTDPRNPATTGNAR